MAEAATNGDTQPSHGLPLSLSAILDSRQDDISHPIEANDEIPQGWDEDTTGEAERGFCIECEDQPAQVHCESCQDDFCDVCFAAQHRKGTRRQHKKLQLTSAIANGLSSAVATDEGASSDDSEMDVEERKDIRVAISDQPATGKSVGTWFLERAKYIPVRLTLPERKFLRLLEAALMVSEYTDKVDTIGFNMSKPKRIVQQIREICAIMSGLVLAADYKQGQELFADRDFESNSDFYQKMFELGRRYKIMNPDKMRTTYGKLVYLLQDSQIPDVKDILNFSCVQPIETVYATLERHDALSLLQDDSIAIATMEIYSDGRNRREVQRDSRKKEQAVESLSRKYAGNGLSQETVRQCIYSIGDNNSFLRTNRDPCERMISYLKQHFHPTQSSGKFSLAIRSGKEGARLSHDHARQYSYVLQSLTLWREILHDMFKLWSLAEQDLLSTEHTYRLRDTGQGLNRVQAAPRTSRFMHAVLHKAQTDIGSWVGSSVIHMGDHNVPNAFMFIDKYSQIYRILLPICNALSQIPALMERPAIRSYIEDDFGSGDGVAIEILGDFFRHAFDGSGADNFFDAGSCIDGRLTSAWNWCSNLEKKRYFPVFLLSGFIGFDGDW